MPMTLTLLAADGAPTSATNFLLVHRGLRRDLARFPLAVRNLSPGDSAQARLVVDHWQRVRGVLDEHHAAEDERLFPALLAAEPALAEVLAVLDGQHAALDGALAAIESALAELPGAGAARAADLLAAFAADLDGHLALEEEHLVPVMLRAAGQSGGAGRGAGFGEGRAWALAWATEGLDAGTLAAVLRALPSEVAEQVPGWRRDHEAVVGAVWRDLPGDRGPIRPLGWWLKEADTRLDAAFDRRLEGRQVDRRGWQVLATLAGRPSARREIAGALAAFDGPDVVDAVVGGLRSRGWIEESGGLLRLTPDGEHAQRELAPLVDDLRGQVAAALPHDDHATLVRLLEQLVAAL